MQSKQLEVALDIILREVDNDQCKFDDCVNIYKNVVNWEKLEKTLFQGIDYNVLKCGVESMIQQRKHKEDENIVEKIVYKGLFIIYKNTSQVERFLYLTDLLKYFYDKLVQRFIRLQKHLLIISEEDFIRIVRIFIPQIKLDVITHMQQTSNDADSLRVAVEEFYEYLLYPKILREDCYQIIKKKFPEAQIEFTGLKLRPLTGINGLTSVYFQLIISAKLNEVSGDYNFFVKYFPETVDDVWQTMGNISFDKEETFYTTFIPMVKKLGYSEVTDFLPDCYLCYKNLFMVFEDVSIEGYRTLDLDPPFNAIQLTTVIKTIAKLHLTSILFEDKLFQILGYPVNLKHYYSEMLTERIVAKDSLFNDLMKTTFTGGIYIFKKLASKTCDSNIVEKMASQVYQEYYKIYDVSQPSLKYRNVITHGDLYCHNVMFNESCTKCYLIDFAAIKWCPPSYDISFFLYMTTDRLHRSKYSLQLYKCYIEETEELLLKHSLSEDSAISYTNLINSIEEIKLQIRFLIVGYLQIKLVPPEVDPTGGDSSLKNYMSDNNSKLIVLERMWNHMRYRYKIEELVTEDIEDILKLN